MCDFTLGSSWTVIYYILKTYRNKGQILVNFERNKGKTFYDLNKFTILPGHGINLLMKLAITDNVECFSKVGQRPRFVNSWKSEFYHFKAYNT